jgi:hypothetical protein
MIKPQTFAARLRDKMITYCKSDGYVFVAPHFIRLFNKYFIPPPPTSDINATNPI